MKNLLIEYSLVIPCYNESRNLPALINRCQTLLNGRENVEVVLVDNGSTDDTQKVLEKILANTSETNIQIVHVKENQGYGFGIISGLKKCKGDVIGWTHADLQTDPLDFVGAIDIFNNVKHPSNVFVKGDRINRPFKDVLFTRSMPLVEWLLLGSKLWDINAQPTVFSKSFFNSLSNMPNDFSLDLFVYYKAVNHGMKIERFSVNFGARLTGEGHNEKLLSKLKYSYKTILYSLKLRKKMLGDI